MIILGLIIALVAVALGAALLLGTARPDVAGQEIDVSFFDTVTITLDPLTLVVAGMVTMFLLWLGLVLIKTTLTRKARARRLRKQEEAASRERLVEREADHDEMRRQQREDIRHRPELAEEDPPLAEQTTRIPRGEAGDPGATRPIRRSDDPRA